MSGTRKTKQRLPGHSHGQPEKQSRIAIVNEDKCKPKRCRQECKKSCPVVRMGKLCIEVGPSDPKAVIAETLCIGCGICMKVNKYKKVLIYKIFLQITNELLISFLHLHQSCPFNALKIVNLPSNLEKELVHSYGLNSFKLHRLPIPKPGEVLGLVGSNGVGKSTVLKILSGEIKPNLGQPQNQNLDWSEILSSPNFRGSSLQSYFRHFVQNNNSTPEFKTVLKAQWVDQIPKRVSGKVGEILKAQHDKPNTEKITQQLQLEHLLDRDISLLSGGELQRFACTLTCLQNANVFMFDEPTSFLDVKQRILIAQAIRSLTSQAPDKYVVVVEHDLSILDYLSDSICVLYGVPGAYGVVTMPISVREGINIFLDGFIPRENLRFREESINFRNVGDPAPETDVKRSLKHEYPKMQKTFPQSKFALEVAPGNFSESEIIVLLGENGTGKTTFIQLLAGKLKSDLGQSETEHQLPELQVSYKPQTISPKFPGTVRQLLQARIPKVYVYPQFATEVLKPLGVDTLFENKVETLSGGELQRVALTLCLGKPADIYLIDEPSAYLDSEQRLIAAKVIKRFIFNEKKTAFVVEHDFIMGTYLADKVIVFEGQPGLKAKANSPQGLVEGMNKFLESLKVTFRRDPVSFRPRINKLDSVKDVEQKREGNYFFLGD